MAIAKTDHNHRFQITLANHQIDKLHKSIYKTDIADRIVKTIKAEIIILYQTLIEVIIQTKTENAHTQTPKIDTTLGKVHGTLFLLIYGEVIQKIDIEITLIIDDKIILIMNYTKNITKIDLMKIPEVEKTIIKTKEKPFSIATSKYYTFFK